MSLQGKYFELITDGGLFDSSDLEKSIVLEKITIEFASDFSEWANSEGFDQESGGVWKNTMNPTITESQRFTTENLINLYQETLKT